MSIGLGLNLSPDLSKRSALLVGLSQYLMSEFKDHKFPKGMDKIAIGIICVDPKFDFFFKPKQPKLTKNKTHKEDGREQQLGNVFEYEIKLDYQKAKSLFFYPAGPANLFAFCPRVGRVISVANCLLCTCSLITFHSFVLRM
ncbi:hypothetical protein A3860_36565 [Niastella vici]|uniref:Uncharacterized protein n=1 Tax=Niastella vici TaxID=1703345 RepID=A0A1V9FN56_9BACT|nr:hypothetical protein [Niastella vici]OQP59686.1 hypothetical protein A3860_36565 [Niastella vici]